MRVKLPKQFVPKGNWLRLFAVGWVGFAVIGLVAWSVVDVESRGERERRARGERIRDLGRVANTLFLAEEARIDSLVQRLRVELRAQGLWTESGIVGALVSTNEDRSAIDGRRLHSILRRALDSADEFTAFELVVAGHDGLATIRLEKKLGVATQESLGQREQEGLTKALWYSDVVRRSVVSVGRRVERADLVFEPLGDVEHPILRVAMGLHDPGALIQGSIVVSIDLGGLARRLERTASAPFLLTVLTSVGRRLGPFSPVTETDSRFAALAARVSETAELPEVFEADGQLVYGLSMAHADGGRAELILLVETEAPAIGLSAWAATSWPGSLIVLGGVAGIAIWGLLWRADPDPLQVDSSESRVEAHAANASPSSEGTAIEISRESCVLRDWLADVRSCLERDASTRGLALELRCERSLPVEFESDPGWLGGLLVAMGREALEATSGDGLVVEVLEDVGGTLRFEIVAEGVELGMVQAMEQVAGRIGGCFETAREGRIALVLQSALGL